MSATQSFLSQVPSNQPVSNIREGGETQSSTSEQFRVGELRDKDIVQQINEYWKEDDERLNEIFNVMLACYYQYRNKMDFSDKEPWQSRITIAKSHAAVKHAVANIMKLLTLSQQPIQVEDQADNIFMASDVERAILKLWEVAKFRSEFRDVLEGGFACGLGVLKGVWQFAPRSVTTIGQENNAPVLVSRVRLEGILGLHSVDPWRIRFGRNTHSNRRFDRIEEEMVVDVADLRRIGGFENLSDIKDEDMSLGGWRSYRDEQSRKDIRETRSHQRKTARLLEYWGDLIDPKTQETLAENMHVIIANGKSIIKYEKNPFWDERPPYVLFSPLAVAYRFPGQGILEANKAIKEAVDRIAQMQEDHLSFSVLTMFEADMGQLENPEDISTGIEPGKIFRKRPGSAAVQAIRQVQINPLQADSFNMLLALDKEYQRGSFITEQTQGLLDTKGETTATEISTTQIQSTLMLSDIATIIEDDCLVPLAEMTWDRAFQFLDSTSNPSWSVILGADRGQFFDSLPREVRISIIQGNYKFSARGLSRQIERQQKLQQLMMFFQTLGQFGPMFLPLLQMPEVFRELFESFHFPEPARLLSPQAQQIWTQLQQNLVMQGNPAMQQQMEAQSAQQLATQQAGAKMDQIGAQVAGQVANTLVKGGIEGTQGGGGEPEGGAPASRG